MKRIYFSFSHKITITARFLLLGLVVFGLILPVGVQAIQLSDLTATPESSTPTTTALPPTPVKEYTWLSFPEDSSRLASDRSLDLLAGNLIHHGLVDASSCADGGMLKSGAASSCGESIAHSAVIVWQNQFDAEIFRVAQESGVPPFVLKNVFIKESQFWPATYRNPTYGGEYSLGHLTTMGVDTLLRWNRPYYKKICNQNFNEETCAKEYVFQDPAIQDGLKGVIIASINADCSTCLGGIDLEKTRKSISVTAAMLVANRNHVQWLVNGFSSSKDLSKENSWRFTLASYNAGPGCFTEAFYGTRGNGNPLSWKDVSQRFSGVCKGAVRYVSFMEEIDTANPTVLILASSDTSRAARMVLGPLATPTIAETPTVLSIPTFAVTETPTASSLSVTPVTEIPSTSSLTDVPVIGTSTTSSLVVTPVTETQIPSPLTVTSVTEISGASSLTEVTVTGTQTVLPLTETVIPPTETPIPTITATPIVQPTAFVPQANMATSEIVVKFGGLVPGFLAASAVGSAGGEIQSQVDALGLTIVSAPVDQVPQVLAYLQDSILVDYAEPNYAVQAFYTPNDPDYINQTYLADMQIPEAWDVTKGEGIIVAVIDTGVDIAHPDLVANIWINSSEDGLDANGKDKRSNYIDDDNDGYVDNWMGWNFVDDNNDARDGNGHGTHTAGIIAAQMDNAQGISGIAPNARIMPIKALDVSGFGTYSQVAKAIIYAVDHGAKIINLGFGGTANSELLLAATNYAYDHNVIVVAAGGNTGTQTLIYPAANPNVIGVSALDENLNVAAFSSYSAAVRISAPGVGIYSTALNGNYSSMSGTSMSAAQISGVAALLVTNPQFNTPDTVRDVLFNTTFDLGNPGLDLYYGYGLARAFDALNYIPGNITATSAVSPTPNGSPTLEATATPIDLGGVSIMTDMTASTIGTYYAGGNFSCGTSTYNAALGGIGVPAIQANDMVAGPIPLGFEFWYMGMRYTSVYVSSNGWMSFNNPGTAAIASLALNDLDNANSGVDTIYNSNARPIIAPLWDDLGGGGGGSVASYITMGMAPNRTFTFEWWNYQWNNGSTSRVSVRTVLHEGTGAIDFIYYKNNGVNGDTASIGITNSNNIRLSADDMLPPVGQNGPGACPTFSGTENADINRNPPSDTVYTFTPLQIPSVVLTPPSGLNLSNMTATSLTLNWTDNSTGEDGFGIYTSTDGVNYTYFGQAAANATSFNATGLSNSSNNYWKVYAVVEGNASAAADISAPSTLTFSNVKTTSITLNWTDNATNETAYLIYNSTDNINFNYVSQAAANATSYNVTGLTASTTYYWRVQALNGSAISAALSGTRATNTLPVVAISTPEDNSTFVKGTTIIFTGTATDVQDGNISSGLVWYSDLSGPFGTGANVTFSGLIPGTHTITAQSTDANGEAGKASIINITITPLSGPHGGFNGSADQCATCHRAHSAVGDTYLTTDPNSVLTSDAFCLSCHDGTTAMAVSTHSNKNWTPSPLTWKAEADFEVRCIQCHDTHGTSNLFAIRTDIKSTLSPETAIDPMVFTSLTGQNSFDDNASANRLCVSCHTSTSNHPGGVNHLDGQSYAGQSCVACHPHNADSSTTTMDGFMPVRSTNP